MKKSEMMADVTFNNDLKIVKGVGTIAGITTTAVTTVKTGSLVKGVCYGMLTDMSVRLVGGCIAIAHATAVKNSYVLADEEIVLEDDGNYDTDIFE